MPASAIDALFTMLDASSRMVGFTGAGISTESGVPDFRTPGSPWMVNKPIPYQAFVASPEARVEAWRRKFTMDDHYRGAQPSRGHRAFARLVHEGRMAAIITQNIDGLHQASGVATEKVIELHGNGTYAACIACGLRHELDDLRPGFERTGAAPACRACGEPVKSATVSFGQPMPQQQMREAQTLVSTCDLLLVAGSSLVVFPAATLPVLAKRAGAKLVIINREQTELDPLADLVLRAEIGDVLERLASDVG